MEKARIGAGMERPGCSDFAFVSWISSACVYWAQFDSSEHQSALAGRGLFAFCRFFFFFFFFFFSLFDQITNHLDLETIVWVESALKKSEKTMIVVSHDESFLDAIVDHVWELEEQRTSSAKLMVHKSSFSAWKEAKRLATRHQKELFCQQQAEHDKLAAVAERLKSARSVCSVIELFFALFSKKLTV